MRTNGDKGVGMARKVPSEAEVLRYFQTYSNWGRWGEDDQLGTLNLITPEKRVQAARLVDDGATVSCSRLVSTEVTPESRPPLHPAPTHFIIKSGEQFANAPNPTTEIQAALDYFGVAFHSATITHLDSVGHVFWEGKMYNGFSSAMVTSAQGATIQSVDLAKDAGVTRGVLLDIPRLRGVDWPEPGDDIHGDELEAAERAQGVTVDPGDALLVRTGFMRRRNELGPWDTLADPLHAGMHASCIPFLHDRGVALLGRDGLDARGKAYKKVFSAIHQIGIVALGLWLIDNCDFEGLAEACAERDRWEFLFTMGPLRIEYGTGSPVNPIAVF
jgi:kynurenine formamidase